VDLARADCQCPTGYEGLKCQHDTDNCLAKPCGDHGTCRDKLNSFDCICQPGYKGKR
jgi:hypothetical protein